jgi:hypothetical protein
MDLLYLTTIGAKTGQKRQSTVARFPDGDNAWLVHHPGHQACPRQLTCAVRQDPRRVSQLPPG